MRDERVGVNEVKSNRKRSKEEAKKVKVKKKYFTLIRRESIFLPSSTLVLLIIYIWIERAFHEFLRLRCWMLRRLIESLLFHQRSIDTTRIEIEVIEVCWLDFFASPFQQQRSDDDRSLEQIDWCFDYSDYSIFKMFEIICEYRMSTRCMSKQLSE